MDDYNLEALHKALRLAQNHSAGVKKEIAKQVLRIHYKSNLFAFTRDCLGYKDLTWETHGPICKALQEPSQRKLLVVPRNCFKSTIGCVAYPIWRLLRNPNEAILIDSEVYTNSKNFIREISGAVQGEKFMELFGDIKGPIWNEGEIITNQRTKHRKEASITAGGVGTTKVGQHYSVIIGDDYNSPDNSRTKESCQKVIDHFKYNLNILDHDGTYAVIGTRYSENDLIGWILRELLELKKLSEGILNV